MQKRSPRLFLTALLVAAHVLVIATVASATPPLSRPVQTAVHDTFSVSLPVVMQSGAGLQPGYWLSASEDQEFYVTPDGGHVDDFALYLFVPGCGQYYKIKHGALEPISGNAFSFSGAFYASGTFSGNQTASGEVGLNQFNIPGCGQVSGGPWTYTATWQDDSQPAASQARVTGVP